MIARTPARVISHLDSACRFPRSETELLVGSGSCAACGVPFQLAIMQGDNMYGGQRSDDSVKTFELPYTPLLKAGVTCQAALGGRTVDAGTLERQTQLARSDRL